MLEQGYRGRAGNSYIEEKACVESFCFNPLPGIGRHCAADSHADRLFLPASGPVIFATDGTYLSRFCDQPLLDVTSENQAAVCVTAGGDAIGLVGDRTSPPPASPMCSRWPRVRPTETAGLAALLRRAEHALAKNNSRRSVQHAGDPQCAAADPQRPESVGTRCRSQPLPVFSRRCLFRPAGSAVEDPGPTAD